MARRMTLCMHDWHPLAYGLETACYAGASGFSEIWQADRRLARDCIFLTSVFLTQTHTLRVGSGGLPLWTRNPALNGATRSTLRELAVRADGRGRVVLGLGARRELVAGRVGVERRNPPRAMRGHAEALRAFFTMEHVNFQGGFVHLDRGRLDVAYGDGSPRENLNPTGASQVIPDEVAQNMMALGEALTCRAKVREYVRAGVTCPIQCSLLDDIGAVIDAFAHKP